MYDYRQVEAVAAVVLEGSFEKAAARLHITQSAVSQRVKALEDSLGRMLVVRASPVRATDEGQRIVEHYLKVGQLEADLGASLVTDRPAAWTTLPVAINADSLATWFLDAVGPLLRRERVLLDIVTEDQEHTYRLLREGRVAACITTRADPVQGWRSLALGDMPSLCLATPEFAARWFSEGLTPAAVREAPAVLYNRKDSLHHRFLSDLFEEEVDFPAHYVPSSERFVDVLAGGFAYGIVPALQAERHLADGVLCDLAPGRAVSVHLYWHCWSLTTRFVEELTENVVSHAREVLGWGVPAR